MESETAAEADVTLPGARLREAREQQGLTVEEIASDLRLMPSQIRALEDDEHQSFAAPIYIIGYVRKYAERLGLAAGPLIAGLEGVAVRPPPITSELTAGRIPMPRHRAVAPGVWLSTAVIAVVLLLAALWWLTWPAPLTVDLTEDALPLSADPPVTPVPVEPLPVEPEPPLSPEPSPEVSPEASRESPAEPLPLATPPPPATPPVAGGPLEELVLRFSGSSWIEVVDGSGRRLAYRMGADGDVLTLRGQPPFDILLGNAPNVSVEYNGEPYRDYPVSRHNVASFTLGESADTQ